MSEKLQKQAEIFAVELQETKVSVINSAKAELASEISSMTSKWQSEKISLEMELAAYVAKEKNWEAEMAAAVTDARQKVFEKAKAKLDQCLERYAAAKEQLRVANENLENAHNIIREAQQEKDNWAALLEKEKTKLQETERRENGFRNLLGSVLRSIGVSVASVEEAEAAGLSDHALELWNVVKIKAETHLTESRCEAEAVVRESTGCREALRQLLSEADRDKARYGTVQHQLKDSERALIETRAALQQKENELLAAKDEGNALSSALAMITLQAGNSNQGDKEVELLRAANRKLTLDVESQRAANKELIAMVTELSLRIT